MKLTALLLVSLALGLTSCGKKQTLQEKQAEIEHGVIDASHQYTAAELGWTVGIPADWNVMTKKEKEKLTRQGLKSLEAAVGGDVDTSGLKELLNLKKDNFNSFLSTIEAYDEAKDGPWKEQHANVVQLLEESFAKSGVKTGKTIQGTEEIDGLEFQTAQIAVNHPSSGKLLMTLKMYSRLLHGFDFAMTCSWNNETDQATLEKVVRSSKFTFRD